MGLGSFIKKQFIDVIQWTGEDEELLVEMYPAIDQEIQYGATLVVRETQAAIFVNEGKIADVFGPGSYKLTTQTLPVLTNLKNWDKLFDSPFKSDVFFLSTRLQIGRKWGTAQPVTVRDKDFGMARLRAFGMYAYRIQDPGKFFTQISGMRARTSRDEVEEQLRNLLVSTLAGTLGNSSIPFLDMAANQGLMSEQVKAALLPAFGNYGLALDSFSVESVSLPDELQKALETRISMGIAGDLKQFTQYQVAQSIPLAAQNEGGGMAAAGAELATGLAMGQAMAGAMASSMAETFQQSPAVTPSAETPESRLTSLKKLLDQGLITQADYDGAKAEVLKKLTG